MTFSHLSPWLVAGGCIAIAAVLYFLQQLRTRYRVVTLPAAYLWQQAAADIPARVLRDKFRYWWAYLLALLIALLLWLGAAKPELPTSTSQPLQVFYLDASAYMTEKSYFEQAKAALLRDVDMAPSAQREVFVGDVFNRKVLQSGEQSLLLKQRLHDMSATVHPSGFWHWLALLQQRMADNRAVIVHYYGYGSAVAATDMPPHITVHHRYLAPVATRNHGVVSAGMAAATSGQWDRVDVLFEVETNGEQPLTASDIRLTLNQQSFQPLLLQPQPGRFLIQDLPADGQVLTITLPADDFVADNQAQLQLPSQRKIRVRATAAVPSVIKAAINSDPALQLVSDTEADVLLCLEGEQQQSNLPALVLTSANQETAAFVFGYNEKQTQQQALQAVLYQAGLAQIDTPALADEMGLPLELQLIAVQQPEIAVWQTLFSDEFSFVKSAAMPLFISQSLRWLAGIESVPAYLQAGKPLPVTDSGYQQADKPLLQAFYPLMAGQYHDNGQSLSVSLTNSELTQAVARPLSPTVVAEDDLLWSLPDLLSWLLLGCILLLAAEWIFFQRGMMP